MPLSPIPIHQGPHRPFFLACKTELLFFWVTLQYGLLYVQQSKFKKCHHRIKKPSGGLASQCIRVDTAAGS